MGLCIHYSGRLDEVDMIRQLMDELEDIAKAMRWQFTRLDKGEGNPHFNGIILNPQGGCESLCFIFDREGRLRCLADLITDSVEFTKYSGYCSTKTQYAPIETHMWIVGLLRYLKTHYLSNLDVTDEGLFWETGDAQKLAQKMSFLQGVIDAFGNALANTPFDGDSRSIEDLEAHILRIAKGLQPEES